MITQQQRDLRNAIVNHASKTNPDLDHTTAALIRVLGSVIEGVSVERAMGAPGDWGYGQPIGDALLALLKMADPAFSDDQVAAWMMRHNVGGSLEAGRCALEDAASLHLTDRSF